MKTFQIEEYGGKLHLMTDGWSMTPDKDGCKRELGKWLDMNVLRTDAVIHHIFFR